MRRARRVDANHREVVEALEHAGCSVLVVNLEFDILVGRAGKNYMLEIKDGKKPPSQQRLTDNARKLHNRWKGTISTVSSIDAALVAVGL